ncbi:ornithine cyclodeaminase family protein [Streptomyces goshikiensis]|uniref:ornithine cyclodeaminase family protein n=1 Tax=Streptomyces goshikiensis TaxID=1942 RepID=UPI0036746F33
MTTVVLDARDIARIIGTVGRHEVMDQVTDRLLAALRALAKGEAGHTPARGGFTREANGLGCLEWMPHHEPGKSVTLKTVAYSPGNPEHCSLPTILGTVARFDDVTGRLEALADGVVLTAIRTGAASAVASRLLARPDSRVVGLIGAGAQAVTQLHGLSRVFDIAEVLVHDVDPRHAASFPQRVGFLGLDVRIAPAQEVVAAADILCTATSVEVGAGPVFQDVEAREHLHINAIGADLPGKTELPKDLLERSFVCTDHVEQALREGECQQLGADGIGAHLADLCAEPALAHPYRSRTTVFDSTGFALEDHVALDVLLELGAELGLGTRIDIEYHPADALEVYPPLQAGDRLVGTTAG